MRSLYYHREFLKYCSMLVRCFLLSLFCGWCVYFIVQIWYLPYTIVFPELLIDMLNNLVESQMYRLLLFIYKTWLNLRLFLDLVSDINLCTLNFDSHVYI